MSGWYIQKPLRIQAFRYGFEKISKWMCGTTWITHVDKDYEYIIIHTLEGEMRADYGDYIIKGIKGEIYPCKADIFEQSYNLACDLIEEEFC